MVVSRMPMNTNANQSQPAAADGSALANGQVLATHTAVDAANKAANAAPSSSDPAKQQAPRNDQQGPHNTQNDDLNGFFNSHNNQQQVSHSTSSGVATGAARENAASAVDGKAASATSAAAATSAAMAAAAGAATVGGAAAGAAAGGAGAGGAAAVAGVAAEAAAAGAAGARMRGWGGKVTGLFGGKRETVHVPVRKNLTGHIFALLGISMLMLIIANIFYQVEGERRYSVDDYVSDITNNWAEEQILADPIVAVPSQFEQIWLETSDDRVVEKPKSGSAILLANVTKTESAILVDAHQETNGPFTATLFKAHVKQRGYMELDATVLSYLESDNHKTNDVYLLFYVDDFSAIDRINHVTVNGVEREPMSLRPFRGFVVRIARKEFLNLQYNHPVQRLSFDADYVVRGSESLTYRNGARYSSFELRGTGSIPNESKGAGIIMMSRMGSDSTSAKDVGKEQQGKWTASRSSSKGVPENSSAMELFNGVKTDYEMRTDTTNLINYHHYNNALFDFHTDSKNYDTYDSDNYAMRNLFENFAGIHVDFSKQSLDVLYSIFTTFSYYSIIMLMLLYVALLAIELSLKRMIARMQYFICGLSVLIFYVMMLAVAEYIGFFHAYIISALVCSIMAALYIRAAIDSVKAALILLVTLLTGHALVYTIIVITGFGLLISTTMLVIMLAVIMYITRKINRQAA